MPSPSLRRETDSTISPDFKFTVNSPIASIDAPIPQNNPTTDDGPMGPTADFVLTELIRQIPSLTGKEALPLSQMITDQLRRWSGSQPQLTFRRTQIIEKTSHASVTVIDFECSAFSEIKSDTQIELGSPRPHYYASTLVMSDIIDPDYPDLQLGCLWAPAYDRREGTTFAKEADHILSIFRQCDGEKTDYRDIFVNAIAINAIRTLYNKYFSTMDTHFASTDAAIQRACAWGVIAAKSREIEYRLFAASLSCFLDIELQNSLEYRQGDFDISIQRNENDLCCILTPVLKISDVEIRT